ncbi:MAG: hypothetical protein GQ527_08575 [Bacteroidales bacterium]|nr:hypothetical protein [Bacteroidales bacterium]
MNKLIFTIIILFASLYEKAYAQEIEFSGGLILNHYYEFVDENPHYSSEYEKGLGYSIGFSGQNIFDDSPYPMKFGLEFQYYTGSANIRSSGLGSGGSSIVDIKNSSLGLNLFPFCLKPVKNFSLNLGVSFDFILNQVIEGERYSWLMGSANTKTEFTEKGDFYVGISLLLQIGYKIHLQDHWYVVPQYQAQVGLFPIYNSTKSFRNIFGIGIVRMLGVQ